MTRYYPSFTMWKRPPIARHLALREGHAIHGVKVTLTSTAMVQQLLDRHRQNDAAAREDLLGLASGRLEKLARRMLHDYPGVARWEETSDILQAALLRMHRALAVVHPPTVRDFLRLAAFHIRCELRNLAQHYYGPQGMGAHHASSANRREGLTDAPAEVERIGQDTMNPASLALWTEFHQAIEGLPDEHRELFDLLYYQELPQTEVAELLGVDVRTVRRRWVTARMALHTKLKGQLPVGCVEE